MRLVITVILLVCVILVLIFAIRTVFKSDSKEKAYQQRVFWRITRRILFTLQKLERSPVFYAPEVLAGLSELKRLKQQAILQAKDLSLYKQHTENPDNIALMDEVRLQTASRDYIDPDGPFEPGLLYFSDEEIVGLCFYKLQKLRQKYRDDFYVLLFSVSIYAKSSPILVKKIRKAMNAWLHWIFVNRRLGYNNTANRALSLLTNVIKSSGVNLKSPLLRRESLKIDYLIRGYV